VEDRHGESAGADDDRVAYSGRKEDEKALASELGALSLAKAAGDPEVQGSIETSLMMGLREQHLPEEAIFLAWMR